MLGETPSPYDAGRRRTNIVRSADADSLRTKLYKMTEERDRYRAALKVACEEIKARRGGTFASTGRRINVAKATDAAIDLATGEPRT